MKIVQELGLLIALAVAVILPASADVFNLGAASGFAVFSGANLSDQGVTFSTNGLVGGVVSTSGFPAGDVATSTQISSANAAFDTAYTDAITATAGATPTSSLPGTLTPGDYQISTGITLPLTLTFNGAGDYIIRINGSLTDSSTSFVLENGATSNDILFIVTVNDLENAGNSFDGTIFVGGNATVHAPSGGSEITGGLFAKGSAVIQYTNPGLTGTETIDATVPEPASMVMLATILAICGVWVCRRRAGQGDSY